MLKCPDFSQQHIVVVGDVMLDQYLHGDTSRISPEAPVPVVKIERKESRVGGAANVALNVNALGAKATLMGVIGDDEAGKELSDLMITQGVNACLHVDPTLKTVVKLRVIGRNQQLIRLDFENPKPMLDEHYRGTLVTILKDATMLILSDYAKGMLADPQFFIQTAKKMNVPVLVDPKLRDLSMYRGATILTPNLSEFEMAVGPVLNQTDLAEKGYRILEELDLQALLVTQGSQGMTLLERHQQPFHIAANAKEVFDITGAGDTVIAALGAAFAAGCSLSEAATIANHAAGISVGRLGTAAITRAEIEASLSSEHLASSKGKIVNDQHELFQQIQRRKAKGQTVVMTNGCFDILHSGHVAYLEEARALGDCLIIAVNTDASIQKLKGKLRPINALQNRMALLAALSCVDYVIPFGEETPEKLISYLLPNLLVKAADYKPEEVAGGTAVKANGGKVIILPLVEGLSTTKTLEKLALAEKEEALVP